MNSYQPLDSDEHLDALLREWVVASPLPPRFQQGVWQRIARAGAAPHLPSLASLIRLLEAALPRPRVAFAYLGGLILLGVAAGSIAARVESTRLNATLSARYVQSVAPYGAEGLLP